MPCAHCGMQYVLHTISANTHITCMFQAVSQTYAISSCATPYSANRLNNPTAPTNYISRNADHQQDQLASEHPGCQWPGAIHCSKTAIAIVHRAAGSLHMRMKRNTGVITALPQHSCLLAERLVREVPSLYCVDRLVMWCAQNICIVDLPKCSYQSPTVSYTVNDSFRK